MAKTISTKIGTLTIPISSGDSNVLAGEELINLVGIVFYNPSAFTGTIAVEVAWAIGTTGANHQALYSGGSAVTLTAGRVERWDINGFRSIVLDSSGTEAAERVVEVIGIFSLD